MPSARRVGRAWSVPVKRARGGEEPAARGAARRRRTRSWCWPWRWTRSAAALACPAVGRVLVVTDDPRWRPARRPRLGAEVVPDAPDAGLNAGPAATAPRSGRAAAACPGGRAHRRPAGAAPGRAGRGAARGRGGPAGARRSWPTPPGTGTVLLAAPPGVPLDPRFGLGSAAAHAASRRGAADRRLAEPAPRRGHRRRPGRRGPARPRPAHRARWPARLGSSPTGDRPTLHRRPTGVRCWHAGHGGDLRHRRPAPARCSSTTAPSCRSRPRAFDASGLRLLRLGQRVRLETRPGTARSSLVTSADDAVSQTGPEFISRSPRIGR